MPVDFGLVFAPWSFTRTAGNLLDRVVGEVGIDHLTVPAVTGPMVQFRLGDESQEPYFYTEGGWHFSPRTKLYAAISARPHVARWAGTRDTLGPIREYAAKHALKFVMRLNFRGFRGPLMALPETRMRTAWAGELAGYGACTSSPVFRELVQATLANSIGRGGIAARRLAAAALGRAAQVLGSHLFLSGVPANRESGGSRRRCGGRGGAEFRPRIRARRIHRSVGKEAGAPWPILGRPPNRSA